MRLPGCYLFFAISITKLSADAALNPGKIHQKPKLEAENEEARRSPWLIGSGRLSSVTQCPPVDPAETCLSPF